MAAALAGLSLAPAGAGAEAGAAPAAAAKAGKAVSFGVKGKKGAATAVTVSRKERGRGKCVTIIRGLETFDVKLKDAASALGKKYGTGGSVTKDAAGALEVPIQGDFADDMPEVLETLYKVPQEAVHVMSS